MSVATAVPASLGGSWTLDRGRPFVGLVFDYLLIGGGLSLVIVAALKLGAAPNLNAWLQANLGLVILFSNSAHFAASTVRLYTKPNTFHELPFVTMGLPLATLLVLGVAVAWPGALGHHLRALYLTWSPYHYSAQAYGLALMYCYRSGGSWSVADKRFLRLACLSPFFYAFLANRDVGIEWFAPMAVLAQPAVNAVRQGLVGLFGAASLLLPLALLARHQLGARSRLPLISLVIVVSNGVWLVMLTYMDAFVWATVFHGLQYLAIVSIFHVRERMAVPGEQRPWWRHAAPFYLACLGLGYLIFQVWPHAFVLAGFGFVESAMLVTAVVNIHHFIVDAFIWRLRRGSNYAVVRGLPSAERAPVPALVP
jgi:hypothetical protein